MFYSSILHIMKSSKLGSNLVDSICGWLRIRNLDQQILIAAPNYKCRVSSCDLVYVVLERAMPALIYLRYPTFRDVPC